MIKETYQEFGQIYQTGACPQVDLIYGITKGGASKLFHAIGPVVNETTYASDGIGCYLANFLTTRMRGDSWLTIRQTIILAAYILFQTKEHVEGCGGDSHIAVLRESESSGMVDFRLIQHLTEYLKSADHYTGEMLLAAADFSISDSDASDGLSNSVGMLKFLRSEEIKRLEKHRESDRSLFLGWEASKRRRRSWTDDNEQAIRLSNIRERNRQRRSVNMQWMTDLSLVGRLRRLILLDNLRCSGESSHT